MTNYKSELNRILPMVQKQAEELGYSLTLNYSGAEPVITINLRGGAQQWVTLHLYGEQGYRDAYYFVRGLGLGAYYFGKGV